jgi:hypothetical protein
MIGIAASHASRVRRFFRPLLLHGSPGFGCILLLAAQPRPPSQCARASGDASLYCQAGGRGPRGDPQFGKDVTEVALNGFLAEHQFGSNLTIGVRQCQESKNFQLTPG